MIFDVIYILAILILGAYGLFIKKIFLLVYLLWLLLLYLRQKNILKIKRDNLYVI